MTEPNRRPLHFESLDELLADAERVATPEARVTGNWTVGQIIHHLAEAMHKSFDGYDGPAPPERRRIAMRQRPTLLKEGFPTGITLDGDLTRYAPPPEASLETARSRLRSAVIRSRDETMNADHPFLGEMDHKQWTQFHCRHAELHLSFVH